jgi:hypothetical protein
MRLPPPWVAVLSAAVLLGWHLLYLVTGGAIAGP